MLLFHRPTTDQVGAIDFNRLLLSILLLSPDPRPAGSSFKNKPA